MLYVYLYLSESQKSIVPYISRGGWATKGLLILYLFKFRFYYVYKTIKFKIIKIKTYFHENDNLKNAGLKD